MRLSAFVLIFIALASIAFIKFERVCDVPELRPFHASNVSTFNCNFGSKPLIGCMDNTIFKIKYNYINSSKLSCCYSALNKGCSILKAPTKIRDANVKVRCLANGRVVYVDYFHFISNSRTDRRRKVPKPKPLNVLVLILAGISNSAMNQSLPKTQKFIAENFPVFKFNYLQPQGNDDVGKALRDDTDIWEVYRENGFVTAFAEDRSNLAFDGFDFNLKNFYDFAREGVLISDHCLGHRKTYDLVLEYASDFLKLRRSEPGFGVFHLETFKNQNLNSADEQFFDFFSDLYFHLKRDTVLFFVGQTSGENPFFYLLVPEDYLEQFRVVRYFLEINSAGRMVTFGDIYWTLRDFASPHKIHYKKPRSEQSQSLFRGVPSQRLCSQAGVEPDFCLCKKRSLLSSMF